MSLILDGTNGLSDVDGSAATPAIRGTDANTGIFFPAADTIAFSEGGVESGRFDSGGNLLIGRASSFAAGQSAGSVTLQVSTVNNGGLVLTNGSTSLLIYRDNPNNITYFFNGSNQAALSAARTWTNASDGRQKSNITDIKYGLSAVLDLQPRSYKRIDVEGNFIGFVAQELKNVIPEVVMGSEETSYGVDYGSLVAVAFKAIQELKAELDTVKAELATLKASQ
jgi:hypothetical protein